MSEHNGFNDEVLAKLPSEMQKQLKNYTFYEDNEDTDRRFLLFPFNRGIHGNVTIFQ
jgi:hypothetical protein